MTLRLLDSEEKPFISELVPIARSYDVSNLKNSTIFTPADDNNAGGSLERSRRLSKAN